MFHSRVRVSHVSRAKRVLHLPWLSGSAAHGEIDVRCFLKWFTATELRAILSTPPSVLRAS